MCFGRILFCKRKTKSKKLIFHQLSPHKQKQLQMTLQYISYIYLHVYTYIYVYISISILGITICANALLSYKGNPVTALKKLLPLACSALEGSPTKWEWSLSSPNTHKNQRFTLSQFPCYENRVILFYI